VKWIFIALAIISIILIKHYDNITSKIEIFEQQIIFLFYSIINNYLIHIILTFLLVALGIYVLHRFYLKLREKRKEIREERDCVNEFLRLNLDELDYDELKNKLNVIENKHLVDKYSDLKLKIKEAKNYLIELRHENELINFRDKKYDIEREIYELKLENEEKKRTKEQQRAYLKSRLDLEENPVFDKSELNEEKIKILLEEGYKQVNEYCVAKKKVITVLIRPILNHSVAHVFLVWSTRRLLEKYEMIEDILEHETRDADLTFEVNGKDYAIEIETGTLLRKKKQLEEKIKFLNERYENRWMVIVSKRELVKKYNKFGLCTQRKWVSENLDKMLKI